MKRQTRARGSSKAQRSSNRFATNMTPRVPRSTFNRSRTLKSTMDAGWIVPMLCDEILPGDSVRIQMASFVRLATPLHPLLDDLVVDFHWFFAQHRNVWSQFLAFMGEQDDLDNPITYLIPQMVAPAGGYAVGTLHDYMGLPVTRGPFSHSALPFRAYTKIYDDWYRAQELQPKDPNVDYSSDGPDDPANYSLKRRNRRPDYFASALVSSQRGDEVQLPIGGQAPLAGLAQVGGNALNPTTVFTTATTGPHNMTYAAVTGLTGSGATPASPETTIFDTVNSGLMAAMSNAPPGFGGNEPYADLSLADAFSVGDWREAVTLQQYLEAEARGGSRYAELVDTMFGVSFPDRLYRSEYLGGSTTPINVTPVPQTSNTVSTGDDASPQGNLAAVAQGGGVGRPIVKSFVEHGTLLCLASVRRGTVSYQQGLHKSWSRQTRYDHYWPMFANLSEQAILSQELFVDGTADDQNLVFGFQERWAEYKYAGNIVTGQMRSDFAQSLDTWHLSDDYGSTRPTLNATWMAEDPPIDRVVAVTDFPDLLVDCYFSFQHTRCMPTYGVPGLRRF